jgi:hypothetical protein
MRVKRLSTRGECRFRLLWAKAIKKARAHASLVKRMLFIGRKVVHDPR